MKKAFYRAPEAAQLLPNITGAPEVCEARCRFATIWGGRWQTVARLPPIGETRAGERQANPLK
jgi:hypothetical protein